MLSGLFRQPLSPSTAIADSSTTARASAGQPLIFPAAEHLIRFQQVISLPGMNANTEHLLKPSPILTIMLKTV